MSTFYGKYRGVVRQNVDPLLLGRVQVSVPAVLGDGELSWAEVCVPYAGKGVGLFAVPPVDAHVWVEFEAGDSQRPIVAGCYWAPDEVPADPAVPEVKVWRTEGVTLTLSDLPGAGGLTVEVASPAVQTPMKLTMTSEGIALSVGASTVELTAAKVSVNGGALEVI
ncbi:phage baseplate assembly protein V [Georgenia subflava]|uniref:Baseplate assembly protein n=1 Tax=Georgenia subflava TaxID=1622177 RepID=A0A6N7EGZ9_9MICO|nr:phage baseplate assembly protein V [Georgenia subflava]MPV37320.1 baseplate assembly protein [Georgenia subflava]